MNNLLLINRKLILVIFFIISLFIITFYAVKEGPFNQTTAEDPQPHDPNAPTRGFDLQFMVDVDFVTVALGGIISYDYEKYVRCENCKGTGHIGEKNAPNVEGNAR